MNVRRGPGRPAFAFCAAAAIFGGLLYALLPATVYALDDDFGYLRSIVATLQRSRPWTHDFLEPWSASHSLLCALAYRLTGNFHAATYGLQAGFGALSFVAMCLLLRARTFPTWAAIAGGLLLLTFPVLFWRALEFTSMALYVPCLLWAIWAAEHRRWLVFGIATLLAVTSRQSAAAWLAWPAFELGRALLDRRGQPRAWIGPATVLAAGAIAIALLAGTMNLTTAQQRALRQTLDLALSANAGRSVGIGALVVFASAGVAAVLRAASASPLPSRHRITAALLTTVAIAAGLAWWFDPVRHVIMDHVPLTNRSGGIYAKLIGLIGISGWVAFRFRLRGAPLLCAGASLLLLSARPGVWDYYLIDAALFAFFAVVPALSPAAATAPDARATWLKPAATSLLVAALALVALFHARTAAHLKALMDGAVARCTVFERALRTGKIAPLEIHDATFGYKGWQLYDYGTAREASRRWFSDSLFPRRQTVALEVTDLRSPARAPDTAIADETFRIGWRSHERFRLVRLQPPDPTATARGPRHAVFPLNNREWRELIDGPGKN